MESCLAALGNQPGHLLNQPTACAKKKNHSRQRSSLAVGVQEQLLAFRRTSSVVCVVQALRISCGGMGSAKRVTAVGIIWV